MDNHQDIDALTESQVIRIVTTQLEKQLPELEARLDDKTRAVVNAALSDVPTSDTVSRMIEQKVATAREDLQRSINSVDEHLRQAESRVSEGVRLMSGATTQLNGSSQRFDAFIIECRELFAGIRSKVELVIKEVDMINDDIDTQRDRITRNADTLDELKYDIHGDPTKPEMPSLFRAIALTNDSVKSLDRRVARYDTFVDIVTKVWQNKFGRALIMVMLGAFATDAVYQATHIIQSVLGGKTP